MRLFHARNTLRMHTALLLAGWLLVSAMLAVDARAAHFVVNTCFGHDSPDANPGDGQALAADGLTPLRAAIEEANAYPGADLITFDPSAFESHYNDTVWCDAIFEGVLAVTDDLSIVNDPEFGRLTIMAGHLQATARLLTVAEGVRVLMESVSVQGYEPLEDGTGGLLYIAPGASVTIQNSSLHSSVTRENGGAVYNDHGTLRLVSGRVSGDAEGHGGGVYNAGGEVILEDGSWAGGDSGGHGGGIYNEGGSVHVLNSELSGGGRGGRRGLVQLGRNG